MTEETALTTTPGTMVPELTNKIIALMDAADRLGKWIAVTHKLTSLESGKLVAMKCLTEGMTPDEFFQKYHVLATGQVVLTANASLGKFKALGGKYKIIRNDENACEIEFEWQGQKTLQSFTIEQARKKNLVKPNSAWATWPEDQLMWTVCRKYFRRYVPEQFAGMWNPDGSKEEEIIDYGKLPAHPAPSEALIEEPEIMPPEPPAGAGGLDRSGNLLDDPTPETSIADKLLLAGVPLDSAIAFLRDVPHWLDEKAIAGLPAKAVLDTLKDNQKADLKGRFDEFCRKVHDYEETQATAEAGGDKDSPVRPAPGRPADKQSTDAPGSLTAPATKRKRRSPEKPEPAPAEEAAGTKDDISF